MVKRAAGTSLIHLAARQQSGELMERLLKLKNLDVNFRDDSGSTALHVACELNNVTTAIALLDHPGE